MARKKLLSEGEVRQFMKLADLGALSENYFSSTPIEEESEESALHATEDELGAEDHFADEEGDELDALEDELPGEEGELSLSDEEALAIIDLAGRLEAAMGGDVEGGDELEVDAELEGPEVDLEMDDEEVPGGMDMYQEGEGSKKGDDSDTHSGKDYQEGQELDEFINMGKQTGPAKSTARGSQGSGVPTGGGKGAKDDYDCPVGMVAVNGKCVKKNDAAQGLDQDAVVAEVARRVAERLSANKRKDEMAAQLAERIFERLTSK
tara:strand:+ start:814 stop:1605 length:792 start_codon:yes stop_codon:yes gene_type:complete